MLPHTDFAAGWFSSGASAGTRALYRASFPVGRALMRLGMGIDAPRAEASRRHVDAAFDRLERYRRHRGRSAEIAA